MGAKFLVGPLTQIMNKSKNDGVFPEQWKNVVVTSVLINVLKLQRIYYYSTTTTYK